MRKTAIMILAAAIALLVSCATLEKESVLNTVTVSGSATISVEADCASFTMTAEATCPTTEEARNTTSAMIGNAVALLEKEFGISKGDLRTEYMYISPYYEWLETGRTLVGQKATQSVSVKIRGDLDNVGRVYDSLSVLDGIYVSSISYSREDTSEDVTKVREMAALNAREKAAAYARGLGLRVGSVLTVSDGSSASVYTVSSLAKAAPMLAEAAVVEDAGYYTTSYYQGELTVSDSVVVVFTLTE